MELKQPVSRLTSILVGELVASILVGKLVAIKITLQAVLEEMEKEI